MGTPDRDGLRTVTNGREERSPPKQEEFEVTLLGPGYGESVVVHTGGERWMIIDSCIGASGCPRALEYLANIGVDPARAVDRIVATHWHDDHIRGMAKLVQVCRNAEFCCAGALCDKEFLAAVHALEQRHFSAAGSGVRELHSVFSQLESRASPPTFAFANRRIHVQGGCEVWSLSPHDAAFRNFLASVGRRFSGEGRTKMRVPSNLPNEVAVVLWIRVADIVVLLGSDLERPSWIEILKSEARPYDLASVFKVPHHGSPDAHEPEVWMRMLEPNPYAVLTPWRRGKGTLPSKEDVQRLLSETDNAFTTARTHAAAQTQAHRNPAVSRTLRDSEVKLRRSVMPSGAVRLRRPIDSGAKWKVETFGPACHLSDLVPRQA